MRHFTAVLSGDREITAAKRKVDDWIRYGGPWVSAASALPLNADGIHSRPAARLVAASVRRPDRLAALIALLARTPTEHVVLSGTMTGHVLSAYFSQRAMGVVPRKRFFRGILLLPEDHAVYLGGRHRKTLRRNLRRAAADGIYCEVVVDRQRALEDISEVLRHHPRSLTAPAFHTVVDRVRAMAQRTETTVIVARDQAGRPVAMLTCVIDDRLCLITSAVAVRREPRWALHDHLVRLLITRHVRYLMGDGEGPFGALGYEPSVQHYQHLLGYELRHVLPADTRRRTRKRRPVAPARPSDDRRTVAVPTAAAGVLDSRTTSHRPVGVGARSSERR